MARMCGRRTVCHVHEAEGEVSRPVRVGLALPLLWADAIVANSESSASVLSSALPILGKRMTVVYNGIAEPDSVEAPRGRAAGEPFNLVLVGRWSPRKGTDVALEALARLRQSGIDARLRLCGSVFAGYEWFEDELRARAALPDLAGAVDFCGYVPEPAHEVASADAVVVPSRVEPFGNTAVEALLAQRPLVASRVQGLAEIVTDRVTGLLAEPGNPVSLANQLALIEANPVRAAAMAARGQRQAQERFSRSRYRARILEVVDRSAAAESHSAAILGPRVAGGVHRGRDRADHRALGHSL